MQFSAVCLLSVALLGIFNGLRADENEYRRPKTHINKDPLDYTDRDVDSLYDEWEVTLNLPLLACFYSNNMMHSG